MLGLLVCEFFNPKLIGFLIRVNQCKSLRTFKEASCRSRPVYAQYCIVENYLSCYKSLLLIVTHNITTFGKYSIFIKRLKKNTATNVINLAETLILEVITCLGKLETDRKRTIDTVRYDRN